MAIQKSTTLCMVTHDTRYALYVDRELTLFDEKVVSSLPR